VQYGKTGHLEGRTPTSKGVGVDCEKEAIRAELPAATIHPHRQASMPIRQGAYWQAAVPPDMGERFRSDKRKHLQAASRAGIIRQLGKVDPEKNWLVQNFLTPPTGVPDRNLTPDSRDTLACFRKKYSGPKIFGYLPLGPHSGIW
jgi:hypothetical protein